MLNGTVGHVVKNSLLYSYVLSQPFAVYVDAYPVLQNNMLLEAEYLNFGQHGETVRVLQQKLNKLSYYDDKIDGDFGILTEHALKKFQADYNIIITGRAGMDTILALIEAEKKTYIEQLKELSDSIYPGMHNEDVKLAQQALLYFGYYEGEIDGIYGPLTSKALEIAEEEHGIELTKEITKEKLTTLYESETPKEEIVKKQKQKTEKNPESIEKVTAQDSTNGVVQIAYSHIGTPYVWGGESPNGFDCSGFIQYVYQEKNVTTPRTVSGIWNFAQHVNKPSIGDLVFFETYKPGPSHMGIYVGDGKFIHAGESRGVEVSEMKNSYWKERYLGAKRIK